MLNFALMIDIATRDDLRGGATAKMGFLVEESEVREGWVMRWVRRWWCAEEAEDEEVD